MGGPQASRRDTAASMMALVFFVLAARSRRPSEFYRLETNIGEGIRLEPRGVPESASNVSTMFVVLVGCNNIP